MGETAVFPHPTLPPNIADAFQKEGVSKCFVGFYSSKPTGVLESLIRESVERTLPAGSLFGLVNFPIAANVLNVGIRQHFDGDQASLRASTFGLEMAGSYIYFAVPIRGAGSSSDDGASGAIERCAALASLLHGEFVATEKHFAGRYDLQSNSVELTAEPFFVRQSMDEEFLNQGLAQRLDELRGWEFRLSDTALVLLSRSHHERDANLKFLFLWLAVEAVLGNGGERRRFALNTMSSELLNNVINRLRVKRDALLHDGLLGGLDHADYLRLKCVLIMGVSHSMSVRRALLDYLTRELAL